jgi:hypothetical protein
MSAPGQKPKLPHRNSNARLTSTSGHAAASYKWRAIARVTAWKDYAQKTPLSAELLKLAEGIPLS